MRLVEEDEAVLPEEARMYGLHAVRYAIAAKQPSRADLIDGRTENRRLGWRPHPVVLQRCTPAQALRDEWRPAITGQGFQSIGDLDDHGSSCFSGTGGIIKNTCDLFGTGKGVIHDQTPIDDHRDPQSGSLRCARSQRQMEDSGVHCHRLPCSCRQFQNNRPLTGRIVDGHFGGGLACGLAATVNDVIGRSGEG